MQKPRDEIMALLSQAKDDIESETIALLDAYGN